MKSDEDRCSETRDELLIEMARALQYLIGQSVQYQSAVSPMTIMGRIEAHIEQLRRDRQ